MSRNGRGSVDMDDIALDIEGLEVEDRRGAISGSRRLFHRHYNRLKEHVFDAYSPGECLICNKSEGTSEILLGRDCGETGLRLPKLETMGQVWAASEQAWRARLLKTARERGREGGREKGARV